ncbi:MAG: glycosyltransferase [Candidatus Taylorbacteria bacterium]|nr:glycosyltransferase [Candidatus Taylorbacteria bacterium]
MNNTPKISIVMPFYNCEAFLRESIESILNQTFRDFEFIIINDGSTDKSNEIMDEYKDSDPRIIYIKNIKNVGIVENLILGLSLAQSNIIARMDGDDISEPTRLEKQYEFLINNPDIIVVGSFINIIDQCGKVIGKRTKPTDPESIKKNVIIYNPVVHPSVMFRKDVILKVGGYRHPYWRAQDTDLWYRIVFSGYKISNLPEFLLKYRYHSNSTSRGGFANSINDYKLRIKTIKNFKLRLSPVIWLLIYLQLLVGVLFNGRRRQDIERWYKIIFLHGE